MYVRGSVLAAFLLCTVKQEKYDDDKNCSIDDDGPCIGEV